MIEASGEDGLDDVEWTVEVVILRRRPDGSTAAIEGHVAIRLEDADAATGEALAGLLASRRVLFAPTDLPVEVVRVVGDQDIPPAFRTVPELHEHRAVVLDDDQCRIAGHHLRLHLELGLYAELETDESA